MLNWLHHAGAKRIGLMGFVGGHTTLQFTYKGRSYDQTVTADFSDAAFEKMKPQKRRTRLRRIIEKL